MPHSSDTRSADKEGARALLRVPVSPLCEGATVLDADSAHYLTRVHRMEVGQQFMGFDPEQGTVADGRIVEIARGRVRCTFSTPNVAAHNRSYRLCLVQAMGKADKPDRVVRAATEMGVAELHLLRSERTVVTLGERASHRLSRWKAIAIDAARQSGRPDIPALNHSHDLAEALGQLGPAQLKLLLAADAESDLAELLGGASAQLHTVTLLIGPEGGFSKAEEAQALAHGFVRCRLADYVMRTETAAVAVLGAVVAVLAARKR